MANRRSSWDRMTQTTTGRVKQDYAGPGKEQQSLVGKEVMCFLSQGGQAASYTKTRALVLSVSDSGKTVVLKILEGRHNGVERRMNIDLIDWPNGVLK